MLRKKGLIVNLILTGIFLFTLSCFLLRVKGAYSAKRYTQHDLISPLRGEEFDPSLLRLNTIPKLESYCDSFFLANRGAYPYPDIVSHVLRRKFFHGYSTYDLEKNPVGVVLAPAIKNGYNAIVIPEDIVQYPNAACSQQSLVGMELFKRKGYDVRKVTMWDTVSQSGHFAFEAFYNDGWHFFDTNQEPDVNILNKYNRPSASFLAAHPDIIAEAYRNRDVKLFQRLIISSKLGEVNKFPANYAYAFQVITKFLTYFAWVFVWVFIVMYNRRLAGKPAIPYSWYRAKKNRSPQTVLPHFNQPEVAA